MSLKNAVIICGPQPLSLGLETAGYKDSCGRGLGLTGEQPASLLTGDSILNLCHIREVGSVGDAQTPHAMSMTPFLERSRGTM